MWKARGLDLRAPRRWKARAGRYGRGRGSEIKAPLTAPAGPVPIRFARILQDSRSTDFGRICDERRSFAPSDWPGEDRQGVPSGIPAQDGGGRSRGAAGEPAPGLFGRGHGPVEAGLQADQARRRRCAQGAVVAGADAPQSALRDRHQGPGRLAPVLRAAGRLGRRRQPAADPGRVDPGPRGRHAGRRRQVGDLEAEEERQVARRPALHRRRRRLQLAVCARSRDGRRHQRRLYRHHGREGRRRTPSP